MFFINLPENSWRMSELRQITVTFNKTIKEFLREKSVLFWTIAWPIIWVLIGSFSFTGGAPESVVPYIKGSITISMAIFALMIAGMSNFPGNIASDREKGVLSKIISMPIKPWKDFIGRMGGLISFSFIAVAMVVLVGYICGAKFLYGTNEILQAIGFFLLAFFSSAGIGMLIGTFIRNVHGAIMTGVGISVITAAISGVMVPYSSLPPLLKRFSEVYPISSANSSITYILAGKDYAGYNPLSTSQVILTITLSILLFIIGLILYSKFCWREE